MPEDTELVNLATALGMACFQAQSLEHTLVSLFAASKVADLGHWSPEIRQLMDHRYALTLGRLVRDATKDLDLPTSILLELEDSLAKRNWVIHHFYREYGAAGLSASLAREATDRLNKIWPSLEQTADKLNQVVVQRCAIAGTTVEQVQSDIRHALEEYLHNRAREA